MNIEKTRAGLEAAYSAMGIDLRFNVRAQKPQVNFDGAKVFKPKGEGWQDFTDKFDHWAADYIEVNASPSVLFGDEVRRRYINATSCTKGKLTHLKPSCGRAVNGMVSSACQRC